MYFDLLVDLGRENDYWVCEKSNGIKVLVLVLENGMYVMDSTFHIFVIESDVMTIPVLGRLNEQQNMTLLDAELTYNYHYEKYCLMICDVIAVNGEYFSEVYFSKRLRALRDKLIVPFRDKYNDDEIKNLPLQILGKDFVKSNQILSIIGKITKYDDENEPSGTRYLYNNGKRYNDNDGLIFSREELPYRPNRCISLKKWNWENMNTVNFKVSVYFIDNKPSVRLYLMNTIEPELIEFRKVFFGRTCLDRLINDLQGEIEAIVECSYNKDKGNWIYFSIKRNLHEPDKMNSMLLLLETVAEDITKQYLIQKLSKQRTQNTSSTPQEKKEVIYESPQENGIKRKSSNDDSYRTLKKKKEM